jgi:ABC-2 type transport system permease protein
MLIGFLEDERLKEVIALTEVRDTAAARAAVNQQQAEVAVIVPPEFSRAVIAPDARAEVRLLTDPTKTIGPQIVQDLIQQFLDGFSGSKILLAMVTGRDTAIINDAVQRYVRWTAAGQDPRRSALKVVAPKTSVAEENPMRRMMGAIMAGMMVFFVFYSGAWTAMTILKEDEQGTLARLFTTPTSRTTVLSGKFLAVFLTVSVQTLVFNCIN